LRLKHSKDMVQPFGIQRGCRGSHISLEIETMQHWKHWQSAMSLQGIAHLA